MKVIECALPEVKIIEPEVFGDARGYFFEAWNGEKFRNAGLDFQWIQDNESKSSYGVVRGLHYQLPPCAQAKLVRVIYGRVVDVAVDIRKDSPTFGKYVAVELSGENKYQLFIPRGFAHGFAVLSDEAVFAYKCDNTYMPSHERGIAFNDPALDINWPLDLKKCIMSARDLVNPPLAEAELL